MPTPSAFSAGFQRLLEEIPESVTLPEWQSAYREVLFAMGTKILQVFRDDAVNGPGLGTGVADRGTGGQGGGPNPTVIVHHPSGPGPTNLVNMVLAIRPVD